MRLEPPLVGTYPILVDLGSGFGYYAEKLREHTGYLVGLDRFVPSIQMAKRAKIFDDLILADILHLPLCPKRVDCVTLFDVIEHLSMKDGKQLLASLEPTTFVSTPNSNISNRYYARFLGNVLENHASRWSANEFEELGYKASIYASPLWMRLFGNKGTVSAWRPRSRYSSEHAVEQR